MLGKKWGILLIFLLGPVPGGGLWDQPAAAANLETFQTKCILVLGDSLGEGMYIGLYRTFRGRKKVKIVSRAKVGSGLAYFDMPAWKKELRQLMAEHRPEVAVVLTGGNDRIRILYQGERRHAFKTKDWRRLYVQRVKEYMQLLKEAGLEVYWMELPIMRQSDYDADIRYINDIFRECAQDQGVSWVPTREMVADEQGKYTAFGPGPSGRKVQLRTSDGRHFTAPGYALLADHLLGYMKPRPLLMEAPDCRDDLKKVQVPPDWSRLWARFPEAQMPMETSVSEYDLKKVQVPLDWSWPWASFMKAQMLADARPGDNFKFFSYKAEPSKMSSQPSLWDQEAAAAGSGSSRYSLKQVTLLKQREPKQTSQP